MITGLIASGDLPILLTYMAILNCAYVTFVRSINSHRWDTDVGVVLHGYSMQFYNLHIKWNNVEGNFIITYHQFVSVVEQR